MREWSMAVLFLEWAGRHAYSAKHHGNRDVRQHEAEMFELSIANALCCRTLTPMDRNHIVSIRDQFRKEVTTNTNKRV